MRIPLSALIERAPDRPPGYVEEVCSRGTVSGGYLELDDQVYLDLCARFGHRPAGCCGGQAPRLDEKPTGD